MISKFKRVFLRLFCAGVACLVCGCETVQNFLDELEDGGARRANVETNGLAATYFAGPLVRPGIMLAISVTAMGSPGRDVRQYVVDPDGNISMELVGQIKCQGLTLVELQQKIEAAYKEFYRAPSCSATFVYEPGKNVSPWGTVTVMGEVMRNGPVDVPSTQDLRLTRALFLAGGVTSIADKRRVQVTRCDKDGKQTKTIVDLVEIGEKGRADKDMLLKAGDVVWVPMSWY
ncbi:MAG: polysaccharide biosynthesis/export family protein [Kiritimatiellia bacterium]